MKALVIEICITLQKKNSYIFLSSITYFQHRFEANTEILKILLALVMVGGFERNTFAKFCNRLKKKIYTEHHMQSLMYYKTQPHMQ